MPSPRKTTDPKPAAKPRKAPAKAKAATGVEPAAARRARKPAAAPEARRPAPDYVGGGGYDLVIVESPAKAKTINKYLGNRFRVLASYGHVRDLATGRKQEGEQISGIKIEDGWKLRYLVDAGTGAKKRKGRRTQREILDELQTAALKAERVLLASDPDREGESIAWHIADELQLPPGRTFRIRFNEITKNAVQQAIAGAAAIDMDRVKAQEARRAMDRVVGFPLSSLLGNKVTRGLSAGRVQSVAVKLVVDREREIEAFRTEEYWKITALLAPDGSGVTWKADPKKSKILAKKKPGDKAAVDAEEAQVEGAEAAQADAPEGEAPAGPAAEKAGLPAPPPGTFLAELARWNGAEAKIGTEADADRIAAALNSVAYAVSKIEQKERQERAPAPFTTSNLQQQASLRLRFGVSRTMQTAQKLYEGIDLGKEGTVALITYMRTDSTRISPDAQKAIRDYIPPTFGQRYLPEKPNFFASGKNAQEAHEAIRPTDVTMTPQRAEALGLGGDQLRLYTLIWQRTVASQMSPAVFAVTNVEVTAGQGLFRATGRIQLFDGYRRVMPSAGRSEDTELPALKDGMRLSKLDLFESQHFTQPPARFNEASLVKQLEKEGIGRPSTYASIIDTIQARGYVSQEARRFHATETGKVVTDLLVKHFPRVMDLKFTSHFEEELDEIETGKCHYAEVLDEFWGPFSEALRRAEVEMQPLKGIEVGEACPQCGRPMLQQFSAKTGKPFVGCSGYKEEPPCRYIKPGEGEEARVGPTVTDIPCPACRQMMVRKEGRFGVFYSCSGAPGCPTMMNQRADGTPHVTQLPSPHPCPKCKKQDLLLKESKAGKRYMQCPDAKCKFAVDADADGNPVKPADTGEKCEKCNSPMVIRTSFRGPFLSCSGYPKCKNAKSINAELREKLKDILPPPPPKKEGGDAKSAGPAVPAVTITDTCPECGGPMKLQKSRFGGKYFLGCQKYPKCKGTAKVSPGLQAQIDAATVA